jgi:hypothetical protein
MPGNHHLRGVTDKEQRQYEHIKESAEKNGRYGGRAKEVAARTVMKEHKEKGTKKASRKYVAARTFDGVRTRRAASYCKTA